jgi:hypothetical protein
MVPCDQRRRDVGQTILACQLLEHRLGERRGRQESRCSLLEGRAAGDAPHDRAHVASILILEERREQRDARPTPLTKDLELRRGGATNRVLEDARIDAAALRDTLVPRLGEQTGDAVEISRIRDRLQTPASEQA